jgi:hypothetical protein
MGEFSPKRQSFPQAEGGSLKQFKILRKTVQKLYADFGMVNKCFNLPA